MELNPFNPSEVKSATIWKSVMALAIPSDMSHNVARAQMDGEMPRLLAEQSAQLVGASVGVKPQDEFQAQDQWQVWTASHGERLVRTVWVTSLDVPKYLAENVDPKHLPSLAISWVDSWFKEDGSKGWQWPTPQPPASEGLGGVMIPMIDSLPALKKKVRCPAAAISRCIEIHYREALPLWNMVIHLNDWHEWSREQIADWLDTLDFDLSFKVNDVA